MTPSRKKPNSKIIAPFLMFTLMLSLIPTSLALDRTLEYDESGNLESYDGIYYEYNGFNQLSKIREGNSSGSLIAQYFYNGKGERVKKVTYDENNNSQTTLYVGENFVRVKNASGNFDSTYYYDEIALIARKDSNGVKFFYHPDHLGSPEIVTNSTGSLVETNNYLPFGAQLNGSEERYQFTGQEKDGETGLQKHGERYYSPDLMKFTQPDSILPDVYDPQQLNRYEYARNSPQKFIDPSGNFAIPVILFAVNAYFAYKSFKTFRKQPNAKNAFFLALDVVPFGLGFVGKSAKLGINGIAKLDEARDISRLGEKGLSKVISSLDKKLNTIESNFNNIKFKNLDDKTLQAARLENRGQVVAKKSSGEPFDHVRKVREAQQGLANNIEQLKNILTDGRLGTSFRDRAQRLLSENSRLLDFSENFLPRRSI